VGLALAGGICRDAEPKRFRFASHNGVGSDSPSPYEARVIPSGVPVLSRNSSNRRAAKPMSGLELVTPSLAVLFIIYLDPRQAVDNALTHAIEMRAHGIRRLCTVGGL
jgi:hypothetical protein